MPSTQFAPAPRFPEPLAPHSQSSGMAKPLDRKPPERAHEQQTYLAGDPLMTVDDVARRLNVSKDWVWDHSSRKLPRLPVIRMGDGTLRYRRSGIEAFIDERERVSSLGRRAS